MTIVSEPVRRVMALLRQRVQAPESMLVVRQRLERRRAPLTTAERELLSLALEHVALELEHAIEEGRQDALLERYQKPLAVAG